MPVSPLCLWWSSYDYILCAFNSFFSSLFKLSVFINIASQCCSALVLMVTHLWLSHNFQFCFTAHTLLHNSQLSWQTPKTSLSYGKFIPAPVDCVEAVCNLAMVRVTLCAGLSLPHVHIRGGGLPWGILVSAITEWVAVLASVLFVFRFALLMCLSILCINSFCSRNVFTILPFHLGSVEQSDTYSSTSEQTYHYTLWRICFCK